MNHTSKLLSRVAAADAALDQATLHSLAAHKALQATLTTDEQCRLLCEYADTEAENALRLAEQYVERFIAHFVPSPEIVMRRVADHCLPPDDCTCLEVT